MWRATLNKNSDCLSKLWSSGQRVRSEGPNNSPTASQKTKIIQNNMLVRLVIYFRNWSPRLRGALFKLFCHSAIVKVGTGFRCDSFPELNLTQQGKVQIGNNVLLRRNVEIRAHQNSSIQIGNNVRIDRGVRLLATNDAQIIIEDGVRIGLYSVLNGGDSITIKKKSLISGFVYLQTSMHEYENNRAIQEQGFRHSPIILEEDTWIGAHAVILPGCSLGKGSIIGSNAVLNRSVKPNEIVGGVPAKTLKER